MTLESIDRSSIIATLTADELSGYRIDFDTMSVSDSATRTLLGDMLSVMEHMGLRHFGDMVTVECHQLFDGGCSILFTVCAPTRWLFDCCDDLLFAVRCGALPKQKYCLERRVSGWLLTPQCRLSADEAMLLAEFAAPTQCD